MRDPVPRTAPVPASPFTTVHVTISLGPPMARYSMRARQAQDLEALLKVAVPRTIGATKGNIACLGPDEWLMCAPEGTTIPSGEGLALAIVDVSERSICFAVEGPRAAELLMSGCPLDLDRFAVGRATRTIYETVEIIIVRAADERFQIDVWRSFAPWLWTALTTAAGH